MNNKYDVLSLLPYDNKCSHIIGAEQKIGLLCFLRQIIDLSIIAHQKFIEGKLSDFDAQVGENLCQIRAYKILTLKINIDMDVFFAELTKVQKYQKKAENVINRFKGLSNNLEKDEIVGTFLKKEDLFIELNENVIFILICFFLARFSIKKETIPVAIDLDSISQEFNISRSKAKRLAHKYQILISEIGCRFIIEISSQIFPELKYKWMLMNTYKISDENRHVLPCFLVTEVVFYHAMKNKIPVIFIVKRQNFQVLEDVIYFTFLQCQKTLKFSLICPTHYTHQYGMVIYGLSCAEDMDKVSYIKKVLAADPLTLLFANAASHVQFSGRTLDRFKTNPYQDIKTVVCSIEQHHKNALEQMQRYADVVGCSQNNQNMFFVKHIYADQINRIINDINVHYKKKAFCAYQVYSKSKRQKKLLQLKSMPNRLPCYPTQKQKWDKNVKFHRVI